MEGVPRFKKLVTLPLSDPLKPIFSCLSLVPLVINLHAKFVVSSSNLSGDMEGVQKSVFVAHDWSLYPLTHYSRADPKGTAEGGVGVRNTESAKPRHRHSQDLTFFINSAPGGQSACKI